MSLEIELAKFLTYLGIFVLPEWFSGVLYGAHRKIGAAFILAGLSALLGLTVWSLPNMDFATYEFSWTPILAGVVNGLMLSWIWNKGVSFGRMLMKNEW